MGVGTITVSFSSYGRTVRMAAPSSTQTSGMDSTSGRQLFADGTAGTTAGATSGNGGIIYGNGGAGGTGGRGGNAGWIGKAARAAAGHSVATAERRPAPRHRWRGR